MATTISLLSYNLSNGLKMKIDNNNCNNSKSNNKTFKKIIVHNVLSESNGNSLNISNSNTIVKKIKDFGMIGSVTTSGNRSPCTVGGLIRKRPLKIMQLSETTKGNSGGVVTHIQPKKVKRDESENKSSQSVTKSPSVLSQQSANNTNTTTTPGRKGLPAPQAVARRNARERNRVKQVNNGFAALRDRIPEEIAASFEVQGNGRGSVKKLSKVETLRMAVEYIRNLEKLLGFEFHKESNDDVKVECDISSFQSFDENNCEDSISNCDAEEENIEPKTLPNEDCVRLEQQQYSAKIEQTPPIDNDFLPNITTLNGLQYIRIPGTNTYQLISADVFTSDNRSQLHAALMGSDCMSPATIMEQIQASHYNDEEMLANAATPAAATAVTTTIINNNSNNSNINECSSSPLRYKSSASPNTDLQLSQPPSSHQRSPAVAGNEILLQASSNNNNSNNSIPFIQQFHPRVKVEQIENCLTGSTTAIVYDSTQQAHILMENSPPPLDEDDPSDIQLRYFDDQSRSFYEDVVTFKKELNDSVLDTSMTATAAGISDESMIEAIDWWEAHTPKSDAESIIM